VLRLMAALLIALLAPAASAAVAASRLSITVWPQGRQAAEVHRYTLACAPPRGTVPTPARACEALRRLGVAAFAKTPPTMACTDIYGGPEQAHVRGLVAGRRIDAWFKRTNGCEIERWNRVRAVVPRD
jgi:hypothetical protein